MELDLVNMFFQKVIEIRKNFSLTIHLRLIHNRVCTFKRDLKNNTYLCTLRHSCVLGAMLSLSEDVLCTKKLKINPSCIHLLLQRSIENPFLHRFKFVFPSVRPFFWIYICAQLIWNNLGNFDTGMLLKMLWIVLLLRPPPT